VTFSGGDLETLHGEPWGSTGEAAKVYPMLMQSGRDVGPVGVMPIDQGWETGYHLGLDESPSMNAKPAERGFHAKARLDSFVLFANSGGGWQHLSTLQATPDWSEGVVYAEIDFAKTSVRRL